MTVFHCSMVMARVAAEPKNSREAEAEVGAAVRNLAPFVNVARKME